MASPDEPLSLALVGAGRVAADYLRALQDLDAFRVTAVIDTDESAAAAAAERCGVPAFSSVAAALEAVDCAAALVLAPPVAHEALVVELLQRDCSVLCEKPIATTSAAAYRMFSIASRSGKALMMASKFRYVPEVVEARALVADGKIGDVVLFDNTFCSRVDMSSRWNSDAALAGGGVLIDNGCHSLEIARFVLGPLVRVWAHFGRRSADIRVEDTVRLMVEAGNAAVGHIDLSWSLEAGRDSYLVLRGTEGTIEVGWRGGRWRRTGDDGWQTFGAGYDKHAAFRAQLANFAGVLRGTERPEVTAQDAIESIRAVEAAYRSARVGRWVPLHGYDGGC